MPRYYLNMLRWRKEAITQGEFDALVDFAFNVGIGALTHSTLLRDLNAGDFASAAAQFEVWDNASGKVVAGLLRRRLAEAALFKKEPSKRTEEEKAPDHFESGAFE